MDVIQELDFFIRALGNYDDAGLDEAGFFAPAAISILAAADGRLLKAQAEVRKIFLDSIEILENSRGDWLNQEAPARIAKAVKVARSSVY